jgi:hypothetical protein
MNLMNRQRWSKPRLKAALDACEARLSSLEDAHKTDAEVTALEEVTALLRNRLAQVRTRRTRARRQETDELAQAERRFDE